MGTAVVVVVVVLPFYGGDVRGDNFTVAHVGPGLLGDTGVDARRGWEGVHRRGWSIINAGIGVAAIGSCTHRSGGFVEMTVFSFHLVCVKHGGTLIDFILAFPERVVVLVALVVVFFFFLFVIG